jgi:hypothetical protein
MSRSSLAYHGTQCGTQQATPYGWVALIYTGSGIQKNKVIDANDNDKAVWRHLSLSLSQPHQDSECYSRRVMPRSEIDLSIYYPMCTC